MNRILSEVYFNRALLWVIFCYLVMMNSPEHVVVWVVAILCTFNSLMKSWIER